MMLGQRDPRTGTIIDYFAPTTFFDWRSQNHSFQSMSAVLTMQVTATANGEPMQLTAQYVSASFLNVLGVQPLLGRNFAPEEDLPNRNSAALVSYALWQDGFGGSSWPVSAGHWAYSWPCGAIDSWSAWCHRQCRFHAWTNCAPTLQSLPSP
jgi:hypothetical protein